MTAYALTSSAKLGSDLSAVIFLKGTGVCSGSGFLGILTGFAPNKLMGRIDSVFVALAVPNKLSSGSDPIKV